jgi:hypothetical protein
VIIIPVDDSCDRIDAPDELRRPREGCAGLGKVARGPGKVAPGQGKAAQTQGRLRAASKRSFQGQERSHRTLVRSILDLSWSSLTSAPSILHQVRSRVTLARSTQGHG